MDNKIAAVTMRNITKRFGPTLANDKVWLNIYRGEILALLGENGSGKTTLMNMLSGIYFPDEGEIAIDGRPVVIRSPKDAFALGIGMIHQHFKLVDVLSAAVRTSTSLKCWWIMPMPRAKASLGERMTTGLPSMAISPSSGK